MSTTTDPTYAPRLSRFVQQFSDLLDGRPLEPEILERGGQLLAELIAHDDWLPAEYAQPSPQRYQQYALHVDARERFSVVSFVWGPGQATPIHDHTVWGLIGLLRGAEQSQAYARSADGRWQPQGAPHTLAPGQVEAVSPRIGDVHRVSNALRRPAVDQHPCVRRRHRQGAALGVPGRRHAQALCLGLQQPPCPHLEHRSNRRIIHFQTPMPFHPSPSTTCARPCWPGRKLP